MPQSLVFVTWPESWGRGDSRCIHILYPCQFSDDLFGHKHTSKHQCRSLCRESALANAAGSSHWDTIQIQFHGGPWNIAVHNYSLGPPPTLAQKTCALAHLEKPAILCLWIPGLRRPSSPLTICSYVDPFMEPEAL